MPKKNPNSNYYDAGGISVVDIWKAKLTEEEYVGLCKGNIYKYLMRAGKKDKKTTLKDLKKARDYLDNLIEVYENENSKHLSDSKSS